MLSLVLLSLQGFTLDESVGEFVLTQPNMQIPARGKAIYSINEANRWQWDEPLREYANTKEEGRRTTIERAHK